MCPEGRRPIRVLLVDDHPGVRQGLALLLARDEIAVSGEAGGRADGLAALERETPDLALVDLSLGAESGIDLTAELVALGVPVLVYSMYEDGEHVQRALAAGARGYVAKRELHGVLVDAIREVAAGRQYLGQRPAAALAGQLARTARRPPPKELSGREHQVYELLGDGASISEIASTMGVSVRTVESYCARMMPKLTVDGMRALRRHAIHHAHVEEP